MQTTLRSSLGLLIGIVTSLLLYGFVARSPYMLGIGCVLGVYLTQTSSLKSSAIYGAIIVIPLAVYINLTGNIGSSISSTVLSKGVSILLFAAAGGILGFVFTWIRNQLKSGVFFG